MSLSFFRENGIRRSSERWVAWVGQAEIRQRESVISAEDEKKSGFVSESQAVLHCGRCGCEFSSQAASNWHSEGVERAGIRGQAMETENDGYY